MSVVGAFTYTKNVVRGSMSRTDEKLQNILNSYFKKISDFFKRLLLVLLQFGWKEQIQLGQSRPWRQWMTLTLLSHRKYSSVSLYEYFSIWAYENFWERSRNENTNPSASSLDNLIIYFGVCFKHEDFVKYLTSDYLEM